MGKIISAIIVLSAVFLVMLDNKTFQEVWFDQIHGSRLSFGGYVIEMDPGWYPVLNTERNFFIILKKAFSNFSLNEATVYFEKIDCFEKAGCEVAIKAMSEEVVGNLRLNDIYNPIYNSSWGTLTHLKKIQFNKKGNLAYYFSEANFIIIVSSPHLLEVIKEIKREN